MILKMAKHKSESHQDILAGDIGATKTNLAICHWDGKGLFIKKNAHYKTLDFQGIGSMIREFIMNEKIPEKICLGVAGPVKDGKVKLTNIGWEISGEDLSIDLGTSAVLVNDLEATAFSLAVLDEKDIHLLHQGEKKAKGNVAIIAPGTGLGEAGLYFDEDGYHPFPSEGGHCDFAPRTDIDIGLYHHLKKQFSHVSWERVVSGPGICSIYDFLHYEMEREEPAWLREKILTHDKATVISENVDECEICKEVIGLFIRYLAHESANLVLKFKATGGLYIAGGIVPHLLPVLNEDIFIKWFHQVGRLKDLLQAVPVKIILNKEAPLLGAAYFGIHYRKPQL